MTPASRRAPSAAFTLVELLTVIAIVGVLAAMAGVAFQKVRTSAKVAACATNLRQCGQAMFLYAADNKQCLPNQKIDEVTVALDSTSAANWAASVKEYLGVNNRQQRGSSFFCPFATSDTLDTTPICYALNKNVVGLPLPRLEHPGRTLLLRHTNRTNSAYLVTKDIFYGSGGLSYQETNSGSYNYLFADGHVQLHTPLLAGDAWEP